MIKNKFNSILVVEDETKLHESLGEILRYYSDSIDFASNGIEALELLQKRSFELIISDMQMPKMNGLELCKKVKEIDPNQYFIFLTAFNDNAMLHEAIRLHVTGFLIKPLIVKELQEEFKNIFEQIKMQNISKEKDLIEEKYQNLQNIIDGVIDPIRVIDENFTIMLMNEASKKQMGIEYIKDKKYPKCYEVLHQIEYPCSTQNHVCLLESVIKTQKISSVLHEDKDKNNIKTLEQITISPLKNKNGEVYAYLEHCSDVTELIQTQEKLQYEKHYDSLTNLPNREKFIKQLQESIDLSEHHDFVNCIILLNIDDLKIVNESFGHTVGDEIIKNFALWVQGIIKKEDSIARIGGDSFAILLHNVVDKMAPVRLIKEIQEKTNNSSIEVMFNDLEICFSAGIAIYPDDGITTTALFKNADSAMHNAKKSGKNTFCFYTQDLTQKALDKLILESNIKKALKKDEFSLYFQPQYNSKKDTFIGMEVLIRWKESKLGIISPDKFIPYLEYSGLISEVGNWILETIFYTVASWKKQGLNPGKVSVNVSLYQLKESETFIKNITNLLEKSQCDPNWIGLEITESSMMGNFDKTISTLKKLKDLGFYLLIDDFGTGYSSLSHLKNMPIDKLKIDKSFVDGVTFDKDDQVIAKTIIDLAHNLNLDVIAEGVETKEQIEFLKDHGCYDIQGFYYSKPLSQECVEKTILHKG